MILRAALALLWLQLWAPVAGQSSGPMELPAITGPAQGNNCGGGCYVVADVAGVFFGSQQLTQTETQVVSVGQGRNGTNVTVTSVVSPEGQFTFGTAGLVTGQNGGGVQFAPGTVITVNGATLTSPTAYEVFTAYSLTSTTVSNGQCVAVAGPPVAVNPAFSVMVPEGAGADFASSAESSFIAFLGVPTCSPGGANIAPTTHTVVNSVTETSTTTGPLTMMPQAVSTVAPSTSVSATLPNIIALATSKFAAGASTASSAAATTTQVSVGTIVVVGNATGSSFVSPAISIFKPGGNAAPAPRVARSAVWAGVATVAVSLAACVLL